MATAASYSGDEQSSFMGEDQHHEFTDKPIYLLEHLATFTVNKESGILYPADGMRRLLQLEKTTGIWSQKMQICLDRQWVLIIDFETGNIIERFPSTLIQEPTAFTSSDPMEIYNNILVFIVGGGNNNANMRSEMHIFQCQSINAIHLVEDLKQLRNGNFDVIHQNQRNMVPMGANPNEHSHHNVDNNSVGSGIGNGVNHHDEISSTTSDKYERDVTVLNHCFDDIEKFIARLQHAAAAARELEKRRKSRKSKKKDPGEGLLTLRTRPPHEKEFLDIFAKFKLSFNLLAKLKSHIHDPNAPELVHFLFTPLALIVDASHDTYYDPNLPSRCIQPLLTSDAINLLINCVTSRETELWRSLGDAWIIPKDQWKGPTGGSYHPVFFDGWSPDYPVVDELENVNLSSSPIQPATMSNLVVTAKRNTYHPQEYDYDPSGGDVRDFSARSDISLDSIERNGNVSAPHVYPMPQTSHSSTDQMQWLDELHARNAKVVQVTYPRTANNDKELTVARGEYLEVLDDTRKWWKARNQHGRVAHVPHTIVTPINMDNGGNNIFKNPLYQQKHPHNDSMSDRNLDNDDSLSQSSPNAEWNNRYNADRYSPDYHETNNNNNDHAGQIRASTSSIIYIGDGSNNKLHENKRVSRPKSHVPPPIPPPPPPLPLPSSEATSRNNTISRKSTTIAAAQHDVVNNSDVMQEELKQVLKNTTMFREKRRNLEIIKTPEIFIHQTSSPQEVEKWLKAKGFKPETCKKLHGLKGSELFALKRHTLEEYCGPEEGKRLASQITVQRNVSGYKTYGTSELQSIMARIRQKSESTEADKA